MPALNSIVGKKHGSIQDEHWSNHGFLPHNIEMMLIIFPLAFFRASISSISRLSRGSTSVIFFYLLWEWDTIFSEWCLSEWGELSNNTALSWVYAGAAIYINIGGLTLWLPMWNPTTSLLYSAVWAPHKLLPITLSCLTILLTVKHKKAERGWCRWWMMEMMPDGVLTCT